MLGFLPKLDHILTPRLLPALVLFCFLIIPLASHASYSVDYTDPADNATQIGRNPVFILYLPLNTCDMAGAATVKETGSETIIENIMAWSFGGLGTTTVTIPTTVTLDANKAYHVDIGALAECGDPGNMMNNVRIDFTTGSCTGGGECCYNPPLCLGPCFGNDNILHLSPPDNGHFMQSYEGLNIVFNGPVSMGSGNITIHKYSDDSTFETIDVTSNKVTGWGTASLTINPNGNLLNDTQYYVNFDMEGYSGTENKTKWNFYTKSTPNSFSGSGL